MPSYNDLAEGDWEPETEPDAPKRVNFQDIEDSDEWTPVHAQGALGSAVRGAVTEALPGAAGAAVGIPTAVGVSGVATPFAGVPAGMAAGAGAAYATSKAQNWLLEQLGLRGPGTTGFFSEAQEEANKMEHPYATFAGELAGNVAPGFGAGRGAMKAARAIGAGLQGGVEAGTEYARGEDLDPAKIAMSAGAGAIFAKPRKWLDQLDMKVNPSAHSGFQTQGDPYGPTPPTRPQRGLPPPSEANRPAMEGEILSPIQQGGLPDYSESFIEHDPHEFDRKLIADQHVDKDMEFATTQRDQYPEGPLRQFWQEYIDQLEASRGKARPEVGQEASQGLGPEFTPEHADHANDLTTVAKGVAAENPRAPQIEGAGNPVGAPMLARKGARTSDPTRDYRKDIDLSTNEYSETPQEPKVTTGNHAPDVMAALNHDNATSGFDQQTVQPPAQQPQQAPQQAQPRAEPQGPQLRALIEDGIRRAMSRQIVPVELKEGANSSKRPDGPVYMSPKIAPGARRYVAVHETVEQDLMAQGYDYATAHKIATQAEKEAVERAGIKWDTYEHKVDHEVEQAERGPEGPQPGDKHVSTEEALGDDDPGPGMYTSGERARYDELDDQAREGGWYGTPVVEGARPVQAQGRGIPKAKVTAPVTPKQDAQSFLDMLLQKLEQNPTALLKAVQKHPEDVKALLKEHDGLAERLSRTFPEMSPELEALAGKASKSKKDAEGYAQGKTRRDAKRASKETNSRAITKQGVDEVIINWKDDEDNFDRDHLISLAKDMWDRIVKLNDGYDPFKGERGYRPQKLNSENSLHYGVALTAKDVARHPDEENVNTFDSWLRAYMNKDTKAAEALQSQRKGEADLALNQSKAGEEAADLSNPNTQETFGTVPDERRYLTRFEGDGVSRTERDEHNALREWLNNLTDGQYEKLTKYDDELHTSVNATQDPAALMAEYSNVLSPKESTYKGRRVLYPERGGFDAVSPEETRGVRKKIETAADLNLDDVIKSAIESDDPSKLKSFLKDEGGNVATDKLYDWIKNKVHSLSPNPAQPQSLDDYARLFEKGTQFNLTRMRNRIKDFKVGLDKAYRDAAAIGWSADKWKRLYEAGERGTVNTLPRDMQRAWDDHYKPLLDKYGPMYDELRQIMIDHNLPGDLPPRGNLGKGFAEWMPRILRGKPWEDVNGYDALAPKMGETLSTWSETTQDRDWFTAVNPKTGVRRTFHIDPNDKTHGIFMIDGKARGGIRVPGLKVGSTFKGKSGDPWTVDHAHIAEIEKATGEKDMYHSNPILAMMNQLVGLNGALERGRVYKDIVGSDFFKNNTTKDKNDDRVKLNGWIKSKLPDFEDTYMPRQLAWVLDDYRKTGLGLEGKQWANADRVAMSGVKLFYFLGPGVHMLNEADKWVIGRGWDWLNPTAYGRLARTMSQAVKSVNAQDAIQREMTEAGGNPMYGHTFVQGLMMRAAEALGVDITRNPKSWDPVFKAYGITAEEGWDKAYQASTKVMWKFSDYLLTQRYLEMKEKGYAPKEAMKKAHDFIDSYVMPAYFGKNATDMGRALKMALSDPKVALFGPYHYGIFHTWANMTKNLLGPNATKQQRLEAMGHFTVAGAMLSAVYPALSAGYSAVTGDPHSELEARGASRLADTLIKTAKGEKGADAILRNVWSPSVPIDTAIRQVQNKDFKGQDILQKGRPAKWPAQEADFLAGQWLSPIKSPFDEAMKGDQGHPVRKFIEGQVGLKTPSAAAVKYEQGAPKRQAAEDRRRARKPGGLFEHLWQKGGG